MKLNLEQSDLNLLLPRLENNMFKLKQDLCKINGNLSDDYWKLIKTSIEYKKIDIKKNGIKLNKKESLLNSKTFDDGYGASYYIGVNDISNFSKKFYSMVIAHEIDHFLRQDFLKNIYYTSLYTEIYQPFNFNDNVFEEHLNLDDKLFNRGKEEKKIRIRKALSYFRNPLEILARMTQLKNFLFFRADEKFLIEDFKYVKENYIKSFDKESELVRFQIAWFLNSIKDEEKFVENMNEM